MRSDYIEGWQGKDEPDDVCPVDGVYASCDEWRGSLTVGQDFGCIHWDGGQAASP